MKQEFFDEIQCINGDLKNLYSVTDAMDRIMFTACSLVLLRYNEDMFSEFLGMHFNDLFSGMSYALKNICDEDNAAALKTLAGEFALIRHGESADVVDDFLSRVRALFTYIRSDEWNGEDVMATLFGEFTRKGGKSDAGQVFTPPHIAHFICRILGVSSADSVLDATCGSGSLLTAAINCGVDTDNVYGIELYDKIYALACANMLLRVDGLSHLLNASTVSDEASEYISNSHVSKVIMNPPYERKFKCKDIILSVLDHVDPGTQCVFILPDKKFEKESGLKKSLQLHTLKMIIKLPEDLFFNVGVSTSLFFMEAGTPQNGAGIVGYYMEDDGFETVKNKGRLDIKNKWNDIEDYWVHAVEAGDDTEHGTMQIINPAEHLSYQMPEAPFEVYEEDFMKTMLDYEMFKQGVNVREVRERIADAVLYGSKSMETPDGTIIFIPKGLTDGLPV